MTENFDINYKIIIDQIVQISEDVLHTLRQNFLCKLVLTVEIKKVN